MESLSLHPVDPEVADRYVRALRGEVAPDPAWVDWWMPNIPDSLNEASAGNEDAANRITLGLALALGTHYPSFAFDGFGLTPWEAWIDRGIGMLMRPPARLFNDVGLDQAISRTMPIRIDLQRGSMGGAYIPARLVSDWQHLLDARLDRMARRLREAEYDPVAMLGLMYEAVTYASERGLGLYEAADAVGPGGEAWPGMVVIRPDPKRLDRALRGRIIEAAKPPKKPGLVSRLFGSSKNDASPNGQWPGPIDDR